MRLPDVFTRSLTLGSHLRVATTLVLAIVPISDHPNHGASPAPAEARAQTSPTAPAIPASSADAFVDSIGVNTHWTYPTYSQNREVLKAMLVNSGIRHIRDGMDAVNASARNDIADLYRAGIRATMILTPQFGVIPNSTYWSGAPPGQTLTVDNYLKNYMPNGSVEAVEMPNELDIFYGSYKWHPGDENTLSADPSAPNYYGAYGVAVTRDTWNTFRIHNSVLSGIRIIGPSVGVQVPSPFPAGSLYDYVDFGGFHPYPARANTWTYPQPYGTIERYYWNSFQPSVNIARDPYGGNPVMFTWYQPPFSNGTQSKPMAATETGYSTGTAGGISANTYAKYIPRIFTEYFRNGIVRAYLYELVDESPDPSVSEGNDGLIYHNMVPKPAYTALSSLIRLLAEPGAAFATGSLSYSLSVQPSGAYTRTAYVHELLLQKSSGDFFLLLWHEVSASSDTDTIGSAISGEQRDIYPPALTTYVSLPPDVVSAKIYTYNQDWTLSSVPVPILNGTVTVQATDSLSVLQLSRQ